MIVEGAKTCEICGAPNTTENGWLIAITLPPNAQNPGEVGIAFGPIDSPISDPDLRVEHLCSHACTVRRLSQWLGDFDAVTAQKGAA